mmetsp:Transcript_21000/g.22444  ORF Transcript_21000/g.22444 Transcript_21000/m.22444 type:complete len:449 (-) Transcript_21000:60-1406(-)
MKIIFTRAISALFVRVAHVHGQDLSLLRSDAVVGYRKDVTGVVRLNKFRKGGIISDVPEVKFKVFDISEVPPRRLDDDSPPLFKDWGVSRTWCRSDLDEEIIGLTTPEECWVRCWNDYPTTVAIDFGNGKCVCQNSCQCMADEDSEATVYALESVVFPSKCLDDGGDDDLITEVPESLTFSIENDETNSVDVCTTGCEGNYSAIIDAVSDLWDKQGAEYEIFFLPQGRYAVVAGVIAANFPYRVRDLYLNHPEVDTLILVNVPGSADDEKLVVGAELVHSFGYQTCVPSVGLVSSGGTDLFTAGGKRFATPGAKIGIHSWEGDKAGSDYPKDHQYHFMYLQFYKQICIPEDFYWETLSHGLPMHYITEEEINTNFPYLRDCGGTCHTDDKPKINPSKGTTEADDVSNIVISGGEMTDVDGSGGTIINYVSTAAATTAAAAVSVAALFL